MNPTLKFDIVQDEETIDQKLIDFYKLEPRDVFYSASGDITVKFVGIVQRGNNMLVSIPKHFDYLDKTKNYNDSKKRKYIRLIMDSICQSSITSNDNTDFDPSTDINANFSLNAYYNIYDYFNKYGLYYVKHRQISPRNGNKIAWKDTIRRSQKFINDDNLIFYPLYYEINKNDETIVTECMIFAINYTTQLFSGLIDLPSNSRIANHRINMSILNNTVINKLHEILSRTFKDIDKNLIQNIIIFLKNSMSSLKNGVSIKCYNYEAIWEKAADKYLREHFDKVENNNVIFTPLDKVVFNRFDKKAIHYNTVVKYNDWYLEPDHVLKDHINHRIYIFDSKYYKDLTEIDHKQFMYHVLYSNKYFNYNIFDSLLVPYEEESITEQYVNIDSDYLFRSKNGKKPIIIYLTRLNTIKVLKNYIYN